MVVPSFITIGTGRLIGSIADEGSRSDRSSAAGARATAMSLRSGAARGPPAGYAMAGAVRALAFEDGAPA